MRLDGGSLQSVVRFAQRFRSKYAVLDVLVLSADLRYGLLEARLGGAARGQPLVGMDGFEFIVTANLLSPFLTLSLLLRQLNAAPQVRRAPTLLPAAACCLPPLPPGRCLHAAASCACDAASGPDAAEADGCLS
jgi:NAD(P)-dependent dehydrogenase (short-subunit alcohol dehydrogenase family)